MPLVIQPSDGAGRTPSAVIIDTDLRSGLSTAAAAERLAADGANELPAAPSQSPWLGLAAQMTHFFARLLWVAGILAIVAGMPELGVAIFVVIVINGVFAFAQEFRAELAARRLADLLPRRVSVVRDGLVREISARDLVVGDVVRLSAGDRISADLVAPIVHGLRVDASMLTGESVPVMVGAGDAVFAGTFVVEGEATAVVRATAGNTVLAGIERLTLHAQRPRSPLDEELDRVVRSIAVIAAVIGMTCFGAAIALGLDLADGFLISIGVMVALVPEGMLPTVTLSLAAGAQRMATRHALVRHLDAVNTLGSTTCICTDKTGTLTRNEMSVVEIWTPSGAASIEGVGYEPTGSLHAGAATLEAAVRLAEAAERCSTARCELDGGRWVARGDPLEAAIWAFARRVGVIPDRGDDNDLRRFPFDPVRRRMSIVARDRVVVKGAPESVFPLCSDATCAAGHDALEELTRRGLRVLAVAERRFPDIRASQRDDQALPPIESDADDWEHDLELLGLLGFEDPPRPGARAAIAECRAAGIQVVMVTGDHPATAAAIAAEVGLGSEAIVTGSDLPRDLDLLGELVDCDGLVIARVDPEQKLMIARALQLRGHVVALTGDGVHDGPA